MINHHVSLFYQGFQVFLCFPVLNKMILMMAASDGIWAVQTARIDCGVRFVNHWNKFERFTWFTFNQNQFVLLGRGIH